jgi:hypothetical protein
MLEASIGGISWERMIGAVEKVRDRLMRAADALEKAGVAYAVVGGNAVAAWVSRVDESAVRNTQDVDILIARSDLPVAVKAMAEKGFIHRNSAGLDLFLDGPQAKARESVHVIFANEKVRADYPLAAPAVEESTYVDVMRIISLEALVRMKLTSFRDKDRMHLRDLLEVGLIDESWCDRMPTPLVGRLKLLIDTPEG